MCREFLAGRHSRSPGEPFQLVDLRPQACAGDDDFSPVPFGHQRRFQVATSLPFRRDRSECTLEFIRVLIRVPTCQPDQLSGIFAFSGNPAVSIPPFPYTMVGGGIEVTQPKERASSPIVS